MHGQGERLPTLAVEPEPSSIFSRPLSPTGEEPAQPPYITRAQLPQFSAGAAYEESAKVRRSLGSALAKDFIPVYLLRTARRGKTRFRAAYTTMRHLMFRSAWAPRWGDI